jgi:hypothetical protein
LHFDGANGSSTFTDSSKFLRTVTRSSSGVFISTSQSVFGGASVLFDVIVSYLDVIGTNADLALGSGDFTIDFWIRPDTFSGGCFLFDYFPAGAAVSGKLGISLTPAGRIGVFLSPTETITSSNTLSINTQYHIAVVRYAGTLSLYIDGIERASAPNSVDYTATENRPRIGKTGANDTGLTSQYGGYMDELRIVIGTAVWTTNFTPPVAPYAPFG